MSYQKLNTSRAWKVLPNDDTPLPNVGGAKSISGALDLLVPVSGDDLRFIPTFEPFSEGVKVGMVAVNVTTGVQTLVTGVNQSANLNQVTVDNNTVGFNAGDEIVFYDAVTSRSAAVLYVGTGGNVRVLTAGGDDVVIVGVAAATFIPINVVKVFATDTTASDILALW